MKTCAVMQPTYLPWLGYFNLILNSDVFIFLDDVQYSKNTFFNRNRYPASNLEGFSYLTVPVRRESSTQLIKDTKLIEEERWRKKHLTTILHTYSRCKYFSTVYPIIEKEIMNLDNNTLSRVNIALIQIICSYLSIDKKFYVSSELNVEGNRSERLLQFCNLFNCKKYISPGGAREYIEEDGILTNSNIEVVFQSYTCVPYMQSEFEKFIPSMSIIDLVFRHSAKESLEIIFQKI